MQPLYIPSTQTIIRDPAHRYVHPTTGEVYGRTDYENPTKLAEIGAIPLTEVDAAHADSDVRDGENIVLAQDGKSATLTRHWRNLTSEEVEALRQHAVTQIKQLASAELVKTDWQVLRALERAMLTVLPTEAQALVNEREAIRAASDNAEADVMMAASAEDIRSSASVDLALEAEALSVAAEK